MALTHALWSCTCQKSSDSSLEKQLQNQTSVTLTKDCTLKSWRIWTEITSALEKSINCAVVGWILKFLKIEKIIHFFVRKFYFFTKNLIILLIFKNLKIHPTMAQIMLFSRAIQIWHDLRVQTFVSVIDVVILKLFPNIGERICRREFCLSNLSLCYSTLGIGYWWTHFWARSPAGSKSCSCIILSSYVPCRFPSLAAALYWVFKALLCF